MSGVNPSPHCKNQSESVGIFHFLQCYRREKKFDTQDIHTTPSGMLENIFLCPLVWAWVKKKMLFPNDVFF